MGFAPPAVNDVSIDAPNGQKVTFKLATVYMPNFYIELVQPVSKNGPYAEHWQKHGIPLGKRVLGHVHALSKVGSRFAPLSNAVAAVDLEPGDGERAVAAMREAGAEVG